MMISVITPTYNRKKLLPRTLRSVLAQTNQDFEVIVIDDGSTDGTHELFEKEFKDPRIRYIPLEKNMGPHHARNRGLDEAKGGIIVLLDSDDEINPDAFAITQHIFAEHPTVGIMTAPFLTSDGEITGIERGEGIVPYEDILCERNQRRVKGAFIALRTSAIGNLRWEVQFLIFIMYRKIMKKWAWYYYPKPLGIYHILSDEVSVTKLRAIPNLALSIKRGLVLDAYLDEFEGDFIQHCPLNLTFPAYGATVGLLLAGKKRQAIKRAYQMVRYNPRPKFITLFLFSMLPFSSLILNLLFTMRERRAKK